MRFAAVAHAFPATARVRGLPVSLPGRLEPAAAAYEKSRPPQAQPVAGGGTRHPGSRGCGTRGDMPYRDQTSLSFCFSAYSSIFCASSKSGLSWSAALAAMMALSHFFQSM